MTRTSELRILEAKRNEIHRLISNGKVYELKKALSEIETYDLSSYAYYFYTFSPPLPEKQVQEIFDLIFKYQSYAYTFLTSLKRAKRISRLIHYLRIALSWKE